MTLPEKILALRPSLSMDDFVSPLETIRLQNDGNGRGDYIAKWNHPTLAKPTEEELGAIE